MAQSKLEWRNLPLNEMPADLRKLFTTYHQSHDQMVAWFEADAKKRGKLNSGCVKLSVRENELGFAIASGASKTVVSAKSLWD